LKNDKKINEMQKSPLLILFAVLLVSLFVSSCSAIAGIFKAGMGFGIFIVVVIIVIIAVIAMKAGKK
jgi:predicted small secreted protein